MIHKLPEFCQDVMFLVGACLSIWYMQTGEMVPQAAFHWVVIGCVATRFLCVIPAFVIVRAMEWQEARE